MQAVLEALNRLVDEHIIEDYAIGGAIGASFYIDALQTEDVDAFVFVPPSSGPLVSLVPVYEALSSFGGIAEHGHVRFGEWPLQILTDANPLIAEAIREAMRVDFEGTPTRVFQAEHLCAVALETGRPKDYLRVSMFFDQDAVDRAALSEILSRYGLSGRLEKAERLLR